MLISWRKMLSRNRKLFITLAVLFVLFNSPLPAHAMHIMEGFLPLQWCLLWGVLAILSDNGV